VLHTIAMHLGLGKRAHEHRLEASRYWLAVNLGCQSGPV
jgi:hypothetical protein